LLPGAGGAHQRGGYKKKGDEKQDSRDEVKGINWKEIKSQKQEKLKKDKDKDKKKHQARSAFFRTSAALSMLRRLVRKRG
jgi:hypothetical protein